MRNEKYRLVDTFNDVVISQHRSAEAAGYAAKSHAKGVAKNNGAGSYIPVTLHERTTLGDYTPASLEASESFTFILCGY